MTGRKPVTVRIARWCATHPWRAVVGWLVFVVVCVGAGTAVGTNKATFEDFWVGEAGRAEQLAAGSGLTPEPVEQILITGKGAAPAGGTAGSADARSAAQDITVRMRELPAVVSVAAPRAARDGSALMVAVTLRGDKETAKEDVDTLLAQTAEARRAHEGLRIEETGSASISNGVNDKQGKDLQRTEAISLPVTFVILFVVFGAVLAAGIPVLLALSAFAGAVGLYGLATWVTPDAGGAALSVIFMIGMAVGVDYSLFYLKRAREERERSGGTISHAAAVELAAATSGRAVVDSGIAVVLALGGLYLMDDVIFSSIASGAILVTLVAVAGSLTVLPALLTKLGRRLDSRATRRGTATDRRGRPAGGSRTWAAMLRPVMRRPLATLLIGSALTAALALPVLGMKMGTEGKETFPDSVPSVAAYGRLVEAFPSEGPAHLVVVRGAEPAAALRKLAERVAGEPLFAHDREPRPTTSEDGRTALLRLPVPYAQNSQEATRSLELLRTELIPETVGRTAGSEAVVSGEIAGGVDYAEHQRGRLPWVILFVSLTTLGIMFAAFRSAALALLGVALNLAAVMVSWGVLTLVFQGTWADGPLGFESLGFVGSRTPLLVFAILVGLSTDYQIFVVSRIREAVRRGVPTRQAVVEGIAGSAGVVTSAAVIMVSVFASFLFIDRVEMKQIAVGLTVAVLFDAVVLRALILPSALALLGDRCWWPDRPAPRDVSDGPHRDRPGGHRHGDHAVTGHGSGAPKD
ncbi:MMPL family transporter [Streptomyces sp. NBC_00234]|uniref:MMPL family transporter n=1 Tax=Streptomyces sp. NBC_00234 TaxID=2903638 RepID=UPI002E2E44BB|nr:MMPL family transporter [Streptomyces sp. NBC_00234]